MTRQELANQIETLSNAGQLVSIMQHAYANRKSRTWAEKDLTPRNGWIKVKIEGRSYFLKDE